MPLNLLEALGAIYQADSRITSIMTGGVYADQLPNIDSAIPPYLVLTESDTSTQGLIGGIQWIDKPVIDFEVTGFTRAIARQNRDAVRDAVMSPLSTAVWPGGRETGRYLNPGMTCELYESIGVTGSDVWIARFSVTFIQTRG